MQPLQASSLAGIDVHATLLVAYKLRAVGTACKPRIASLADICQLATLLGTRGA